MASLWSHIGDLYSKFIEHGSRRSVKLKKNVLLSLLVKAGSIVCSLVLVPATINFVNDVQYGIWLAISSIVAWMSFFDIGFTNGLRNKLAESFGYGDYRMARIYISTTYFILGMIFLAVMILLIIGVYCFDISPLLKISMSYEPDLKIALYVLVSYFCITFVLKILSVILIADQNPAYSSFIDFIGQFLSLLCVLVFSNYVDGSLSVLSYCLCLPPLLVWVSFSVVIFCGKYRNCKPSFRCVDMKYAGGLLTLGGKFFIIQIAALIQFQTANFFIARLFSMSEVTQYNIAYKYFNVLYMVFMILLQPFWSAVTEAYSKGDIAWIVNAMKKYLKLSCLASLGGLLMLCFSGFFYNIWVGNAVSVPFELSFWMMLYVLTLIFGSVFVYFVNGIGALKIQYLSSLVSPVVFVLCILFFSKVLGMGVSSILLASIIANFNGLLLAPLQYYNVIIRRREGVWIM